MLLISPILIALYLELLVIDNLCREIVLRSKSVLHFLFISLQTLIIGVCCVGAKNRSVHIQSKQWP